MLCKPFPFLKKSTRAAWKSLNDLDGHPIKSIFHFILTILGFYNSQIAYFQIICTSKEGKMLWLTAVLSLSCLAVLLKLCWANVFLEGKKTLVSQLGLNSPGLVGFKCFFSVTAEGSVVWGCVDAQRKNVWLLAPCALPRNWSQGFNLHLQFGSHFVLHVIFIMT